MFLSYFYNSKFRTSTHTVQPLFATALQLVSSHFAAPAIYMLFIENQETKFNKIFILSLLSFGVSTWQQRPYEKEVIYPSLALS